MIGLKRILAPVDFSSCAHEATNYACALVDSFGAELHLLHVIHNFATEVPDFGMGLAFPGFLENLPARMEELEREAISHLANALEPGWQKDKQVVLATKQGAPFVEIVRYAQTHQIQLIVMGTHGRSAIPHAILGSVAEKVVRKAPCPVLTVRPKSHEFAPL